MTFKEYIEWTRSTRNNSLSEDQHKMNAAVGLCAEAGEFLDIHKKVAFQGHPESQHTDDIVKELGDVCWYLAYALDIHGIDMEEVLAKNVAKLSARYQKGFEASSSYNRKEYGGK